MKRGSQFNLILIVVGSCIGSGIFMTPSQVASGLPNPSLILMVWVLGGIIALSGALTYGELASRDPAAGGVYAFLKRAYGKYPAFMFGWVVLMAVTSGAIAGLSIAFSNFLEVLVPLSPGQHRWVSVAVIVVCTLVNVQGLSLGRFITGWMTGLKVMGIVGLMLSGLIIFREPVAIDWSMPSLGWDTAGAVLLALVGVYWAYGGWHHLTYIAGELPEARKRLAGAMVVGVLGVMVAYVSVNLAYLRAMPVDKIGASKGVAAEMMEVVFPGIGGKVLAALVCLSVFGSVLIYTMSAPRIYQAMAQDRVFFPIFARKSQKNGAPTVAIVFQSVWAICLIFLWKTFGNLVDYVTYTEAIFLVMAAAAVYVFRWQDRKAGKLHEGFNVPGYPFSPLIYVLISSAFLAMGMFQKLELALATMALLLLGTVLFFVFQAMQKRRPDEH